MPVVAFDMTASNCEHRRFEFRGENNADYYDGDLQPLSPSEVEMKIEKSLVSDFAIYKLTSSSALGFRRAWSHIRKDKTNVTVFWFPRRGKITVTTAQGSFTTGPEECAITRSTRPFYMEVTPDRDGVAEVMHVVVPSHKLYSVINDGVEIDRPFASSKGILMLTERVFSLLFEEDDEIDQDVAEPLIEAILQGVGKTITRISGNPAPRSSITDKRVSDIMRYINQHFANPDLNAKMVAHSCGISLRYLCHILKKHDLSFSKLVWERRMETAHGWLCDQSMQHYSICEIAYMAGFKSSSHFSRVFKTKYGVSPREYRNIQPTEYA